MKVVRVLKSQAGFSLVELMIVVAIIGILATVAIPNFTRFQAKARQSSARTLLSGYYTAQKAAYAEYLYYPGNFSGAGFRPDGNVTYRILGADNTSVADAGGATGNVADLAACISTAAGCAAAYINWAENATYAAAPVAAACTAANSNTAPGVAGATFTACAGGNLGGAVVDTWSVTQTGAIINPNGATSMP